MMDSVPNLQDICIQAIMRDQGLVINPTADLSLKIHRSNATHNSNMIKKGFGFFKPRTLHRLFSRGVPKNIDIQPPQHKKHQPRVAITDFLNIDNIQLRLKMSSLQRKIIELSVEKERIKQEKCFATQKAEELEKTMCENEKVALKTKEELDDCLTTIQKLIPALAQLKKDKAQLDIENKKMVDVKDKLEIELTQLEATSFITSVEYEQQISDFCAEIGKLSTEHMQKDQQLIKFKEQNLNMEYIMKQQEETILSFQQKLNMRDSECPKCGQMAQEIEILQEDNSKLYRLNFELVEQAKVQIAEIKTLESQRTNLNHCIKGLHDKIKNYEETETHMHHTADEKENSNSRDNMIALEMIYNAILSCLEHTGNKTPTCTQNEVLTEKIQCTVSCLRDEISKLKTTIECFEKVEKCGTSEVSNYIDTLTQKCESIVQDKHDQIMEQVQNQCLLVETKYHSLKSVCQQLVTHCDELNNKRRKYKEKCKQMQDSGKTITAYMKKWQRDKQVLITKVSKYKALAKKPPNTKIQNMQADQ